MQKLNKIKGFTLPEVIMVTASIAIIAGISFSDFARLLDKKTIEEEKIVLTEIQTAMELYAKHEGKLPDDSQPCSAGLNINSGIWSAELSKYSKLTSDNICIDSFKTPREYISKAKTKVFYGGRYKYDEHYATVTGNGLDKLNSTGSWSILTGTTQASYLGYQAKDDDFVIKYTDRKMRQDEYLETLRRIETLEEYLERYARSKRSMAASLNAIDFDNYIMYPIDDRSGDAGGYLTSAVQIKKDDGSKTNLPSDVEVDVIGDEISAVALTKVLGLPQYYGQNAMTGKPLWYISNPGADRSIPCTDEKTSAPYYPPTIIVTTNDNRPSGC